MTSDSEDDHSQSSAAEDSGGEHGGDMAQHRDKDMSGQNGAKSFTNAKDPMRPRRKKARRACFACQRAHLTCGDERPCQRCIKRGLQDQCQDGVRKKAKYLHDAPNEALMPGAATMYNQGNPVSRELSLHSDHSQPSHQPDQFFQPQNGQTYNVYQQNKAMPPPMLQDSSINPATFAQQSPISPPFSMGSAPGVSAPNLTSSAQNTPNLQTAWNGPMFDHHDPSLFNFDLASMNFGNHYGALEFGMLGHMATGAGETPPSDTHTQRGSVGAGTYPNALGFGNSPGNGAYNFGDTLISDWPNDQNLYNQQFRNNQPPNAFAIETNPANFQSPDSNASPQAMMNLKLEDSPNMSGNTLRPNNGPLISSNNQSRPLQVRQPHPIISTPNLKASVLAGKRQSRRDPSHIYTAVTTPYPYTTGFHSLISFLQKRFASSPQKTLQIAKSLASIRPSFIATTKTLNRDDLVFMEKCFQRTLWEYEGFIEGIGTPTIIARRTGEIAAVGKEFCILTGWKKEVLLGKEPNLNINRGASAATTGASTLGGKISGVNTPVPRSLAASDGLVSDGGRTLGRTQPVFLAELLDDESVVEFYEDFARLAFGDSRGSVTGKGTLLKYRTKEDLDGINDIADKPSFKRSSNGASRNGIAGEGGMQELGIKNGKVECTYCWTVKRDVFDIPMLLVMNFLPII